MLAARVAAILFLRVWLLLPLGQGVHSVYWKGLIIRQENLNNTEINISLSVTSNASQLLKTASADVADLYSEIG
jgi:hypothetical protein